MTEHKLTYKVKDEITYVYLDGEFLTSGQNLSCVYVVNEMRKAGLDSKYFGKDVWLDALNKIYTNREEVREN